MTLVNFWVLGNYLIIVFFCKDGEWRYVGGRGWTSYEDWGAITKRAVVSSQWCNDATEKELSNFGIGKDGEIKVGNITGASYKYDEIESKWLEINVLDTLLPFVCTEKRVGEFAKDNDTAYYCGHFRTDGEQDMYCNSIRAADVVWGPVLECNQKAYWLRATDEEADLGVVCSKNEFGKIMKGKTGLSYKCINGVWTKISVLDTLFFVCGFFPEEYACVDDVIDNKKMAFMCASNDWSVEAVADDDMYSDPCLADCMEVLNEFQDSLSVRLNIVPRYIQIVSDSLFDAYFPSRQSCSALRDSLQLKQNSP